jgi:hypothetical protein
MKVTFLGIDLETKQKSMIIDNNLAIQLTPEQFKTLMAYISNELEAPTTTKDENGLAQFEDSPYFIPEGQSVVFNTETISETEQDTSEVEESLDD